MDLSKALVAAGKDTEAALDVFLSSIARGSAEEREGLAEALQAVAVDRHGKGALLLVAKMLQQRAAGACVAFREHREHREGLSSDCLLDPGIVLAIMMGGREHPCDRCNHDRSKCRGYPRRGHQG